ncbi:MAG: hypothetical protein U0R26_11950 [Solirubrobacterales bacterium]
MARTQAVYYRDEKGTEPVDEFIEVLSAKRAAKVDSYVEEYLNGRPPQEPPPEFPITSQIEGELRELRVRFGNTRYRVLYHDPLGEVCWNVRKAPGQPLSWRARDAATQNGRSSSSSGGLDCQHPQR